MGQEPYQTVDPQKRAPGWQGTVWCPSTNSSLQISIFQIHQIFNISYFPQFNLSFQKKISLSQNAPKSPKNLHKTVKQWLISCNEALLPFCNVVNTWKGRTQHFIPSTKNEYKPHFPLKLSLNTDRVEGGKLLLHDKMSMEREQLGLHLEGIRKTLVRKRAKKPHFY